MTSAGTAVVVTATSASPSSSSFPPSVPKKDPHYESETEDEEVKMNTLGGVRGIEDSDMNFSDKDKSDDDDLTDDVDDDDAEEEPCEG